MGNGLSVGQGRDGRGEKRDRKEGCREREASENGPSVHRFIFEHIFPAIVNTGASVRF